MLTVPAEGWYQTFYFLLLVPCTNSLKNLAVYLCTDMYKMVYFQDTFTEFSNTQGPGAVILLHNTSYIIYFSNMCLCLCVHACVHASSIMHMLPILGLFLMGIQIATSQEHQQPLSYAAWPTI